MSGPLSGGSLCQEVLSLLASQAQKPPPSGSPPCSWLHLLCGSDRFFLRKWELLQGRARFYSRGIQGASSANLYGCTEPVPTSPPRPGRRTLGFSSVSSTSVSSVSSPSFSFSPSCELVRLRSILFLPPSSLPSGPPLSPRPFSLLPRPAPPPPGPQLQFPRRPAEALPRPLGRIAAALPAGSGGRKRPGSRGQWTCRWVSGRRGASFPYRAPSFRAGLGGPGRAPPAPGAPTSPIGRVRCMQGVGVSKHSGTSGAGPTWPSVKARPRARDGSC